MLLLLGAAIVARLQPTGGVATNDGLGDMLGSLGFTLAGAYLAYRRPGIPMGWLLLGIGLTEEVSNVAGAYGVLALREAGSWPLGNLALWVASWIWLPGGVALVTLVVLLYPEPTPGRARRRLVLAALTSMVLLTVASALSVDAMRDVDTPDVVNPFAVHGLAVALALAGLPFFVVAFVGSLVDAAVRCWRAPAPLRQQLAWLLTAALLTGLGKSLIPVAWISSSCLALIPVAIAVGVLRYHLLGIETVVRATLFYLPLTALVAVVFTLLTAGLQLLVPDGPVPSLLAAAVVVLGIAPARAALQRAVDRVVRGPRVDPLVAVAGVGQAATDDLGSDLVARVVASVEEALGDRRVAVYDDAGTLLAGRTPDGPTTTVRLRQGDEELGRLVVPEGVDGLLLGALGSQLSVVLRAARLADELDAARQQAVGAAIEERTRLRRDLHDGLGPSLSGVALGLTAASAHLDADPATTRAILVRTEAEVRDAVTEIRRLIDGLSPRDLEVYGLAAALRERLVLPGTGPEVRLVAPAALAPMDERVELAAYRIVAEAVTNVRRHAGARHCEVVLEVRDAALHLRVCDDGRGLGAGGEAGVGLVSMRHRAEDVGGTLRVQTGPAGGTVVEAVLPTRAPAGSTA